MCTRSSLNRSDSSKTTSSIEELSSQLVKTIFGPSRRPPEHKPPRSLMKNKSSSKGLKSHLPVIFVVKEPASKAKEQKDTGDEKEARQNRRNVQDEKSEEAVRRSHQTTLRRRLSRTTSSDDYSCRIGRGRQTTPHRTKKDKGACCKGLVNESDSISAEDLRRDRRPNRHCAHSPSRERWSEDSPAKEKHLKYGTYKPLHSSTNIGKVSGSRPLYKSDGVDRVHWRRRESQALHHYKREKCAWRDPEEGRFLSEGRGYKLSSPNKVLSRTNSIIPFPENPRPFFLSPPFTHESYTELPSNYLPYKRPASHPHLSYYVPESGCVSQIFDNDDLGHNPHYRDRMGLNNRQKKFSRETFPEFNLKDPLDYFKALKLFPNGEDAISMRKERTRSALTSSRKINSHSDQLFNSYVMPFPEPSCPHFPKHLRPRQRDNFIYPMCPSQRIQRGPSQKHCEHGYKHGRHQIEKPFSQRHLHAKDNSVGSGPSSATSPIASTLGTGVTTLVERQSASEKDPHNVLEIRITCPGTIVEKDLSKKGDEQPLGPSRATDDETTPFPEFLDRWEGRQLDLTTKRYDKTHSDGNDKPSSSLRSNSWSPFDEGGNLNWPTGIFFPPAKQKGTHRKCKNSPFESQIVGSAFHEKDHRMIYSVPITGPLNVIPNYQWSYPMLYNHPHTVEGYPVANTVTGGQQVQSCPPTPNSWPFGPISFVPRSRSQNDLDSKIAEDLSLRMMSVPSSVYHQCSRHSPFCKKFRKSEKKHRKTKLISSQH